MAVAEDTTEEWRPVPELVGVYSVSDMGRVRRDGQHLMALTSSTKGYLSVHLHGNGRAYTWRVARLVMAAFRGASTLTVNHIDGDKRNNRLLNLEYMTQAENVAHAVRTGLKKYAIPSRRRGGPPRGERNSRHKLTETEARECIRLRAAGLRYKEIGVRFGVTPQAVCLIAKGKNWAHLNGPSPEG